MHGVKYYRKTGQSKPNWLMVQQKDREKESREREREREWEKGRGLRGNIIHLVSSMIVRVSSAHSAEENKKVKNILLSFFPSVISHSL